MLHRGPRMTSSGRTIVACLLGFSSATAAALDKHDCATARPAMPTAQQTTFNRDIAPILFRYCAPCHRPGEAGPFPLLTYTDTKARARQVAAVTSKRFMPPDRKSTRLNSSHVAISYSVFCLKKKDLYCNIVR